MARRPAAPGIIQPVEPVEEEVAIGSGVGLGVRPAGARWLYVLGHGAGAGMRHVFMREIAAALAARGIATLRWEMPFMAAGRRRPDPPAVCEAAARAACDAAAAWAPDLRRIAGGKSMGGRMTSNAEARSPLGVEGLAFLGFPLHPAKAPAITRAAHLASVQVPMLFLQGTRDALAEPALMRPVVAGLPTAELVEVEGADHGFDVLVRSGRTHGEVLAQLATAIGEWLERRVAPGRRAP
jgi:predicted alpha/beta-hydrolase family hydrolase